MTQLKTRPRKTVADYMKLPDDVRVELFGGEFFMSPSPEYKHQKIVLNLGAHLRQHVKDHGLGEVLCAPFDCILSDQDVVQPDVLFLATETLGKIRKHLHGAPDLAVEVISPAHAERDRIVKRDLYLRHGVREYWIVDAEARTVEVLSLEKGAWRPCGVFSENDEVTSPLLPRLKLPARACFE